MTIFQDWKLNKGSVKIQIMLALFRAAQACRTRSRILGYLVSSIYRLHCTIFVGAELPVHTQVGNRLTIHHGIGLIVNGASIIGNDVILRHNTTIGNKIPNGPCPQIEDKVEVGVGSILLGGIKIGSNAKIGAGSLVIHDVKAGSVVMGGYAKPREQ